MFNSSFKVFDYIRSVYEAQAGEIGVEEGKGIWSGEGDDDLDWKDLYWYGNTETFAWGLKKRWLASPTKAAINEVVISSNIENFNNFRHLVVYMESNNIIFDRDELEFTLLLSGKTGYCFLKYLVEVRGWKLKDTEEYDKKSKKYERHNRRPKPKPVEAVDQEEISRSGCFGGL